MVTIAPNAARLEKFKRKLPAVRARSSELFAFADADTQFVSLPKYGSIGCLALSPVW